MVKELAFQRTMQRTISVVKVLQETKHFIVDQKPFEIQLKVIFNLNLFEFLLKVVKENRSLYPPTRFVVFGFLFFVVWSLFFLYNLVQKICRIFNIFFNFYFFHLT